MGNYVTVDEIKAHYPETTLARLTDDVRDAARTVQDPIVELCIAAAESQIDAILARRYPLPLTNVPDVLKTLARKGTYNELWARSNENVKVETDKRMMLPEEGWLNDLKYGRIDLPEEELRADVRTSTRPNRDTTNSRKISDEVDRYF